MESEKVTEKHRIKKKQHRKKKKWKHVEEWKRQLGIQGNTQEENDLYFCLQKAMARISLYQWNDEQKESQIRELILNQDRDSELQILEQQREILALKSKTESREKLIQRQQKQIDENKKKIRKLEQEKLELKTQIWPRPWVEGTSFLEN